MKQSQDEFFKEILLGGGLNGEGLPISTLLNSFKVLHWVERWPKISWFSLQQGVWNGLQLFDF